MLRLGSLRGYLKLAQIEVQTVLAYRASTLLWCLVSLLRIYLLAVFWTAVYHGGGAVEGVTLGAMITYATLSMIQVNFVIETNAPWYIQERIREGNIIFDLLRPYRFLVARFASTLGTIFWTIPIAAGTALISALYAHIQPPASARIALVYCLSLLLGVLVNYLISMLIGLLAFWTTELSGINWLTNMVVSFLAGAIVPFWFLPRAVQDIANLLPFQGIVYLPLSIYIGRISGRAIWVALAQQVFWIFALAGIVWLVWQAAQRKLIVQGG